MIVPKNITKIGIVPLNIVDVDDAISLMIVSGTYIVYILLSTLWNKADNFLNQVEC